MAGFIDLAIVIWFVLAVLSTIGAVIWAFEYLVEGFWWVVAKLVDSAMPDEPAPPRTIRPTAQQQYDAFLKEPRR